MDFTFTEDQIAFRDSISRFLMTEAAPELLRDIWETKSGRSPELWSKIAEQGLMGLSAPEADGGMGMADVDWALLLQEVGYYALPDSLTDTAYVAVGMLSALPEGNKSRAWLSKIAEGSCRVAVGHPVNPTVADAELADLLLLPHATATGLELHLLTPEQCEITPLKSIDSSRRLSKVNWKASDATRVLDGAQGQKVWETAGERGALAAAAQMVGLAQRMLDLSVDYVAQRKQFDKVIGSFQAVQHHLADRICQARALPRFLCVAAGRDRSGRAHLPRQAAVQRSELVCCPQQPAGAWRHGLHLGSRSADVHEAGVGAGCRLGRQGLPLCASDTRFAEQPQCPRWAWCDF